MRDNHRRPPDYVRFADPNCKFTHRWTARSVPIHWIRGAAQSSNVEFLQLESNVERARDRVSRFAHYFSRRFLLETRYRSTTITRVQTLSTRETKQANIRSVHASLSHRRRVAHHHGRGYEWSYSYGNLVSASSISAIPAITILSRDPRSSDLSSVAFGDCQDEEDKRSTPFHARSLSRFWMIQRPSKKMQVCATLISRYMGSSRCPRRIPSAPPRPRKIIPPEERASCECRN